MSPIEAGCLAVILSNSPNSGKCVEVVKFVGKTERFPQHDDCWEIKESILSSYYNQENVFVRYGLPTNVVTEKCLMRIDGGSNLFTFDEVEELVRHDKN